MNGEPCWHELTAPDPGAARAFYSALFGWAAEAADLGFPYHFLKRPGDARPFGGVMAPQAPGVPPHWLVYFAVPDLPAAVQKVADLGGSVRVPEVKLPQGRFAVVAGPQGEPFALFQPA